MGSKFSRKKRDQHMKNPLLMEQDQSTAETSGPNTMDNQNDIDRVSPKITKTSTSQEGRIVFQCDAEELLYNISMEYAEKREKGLVPKTPINARLLLWEEMNLKKQKRAKRGTCIFGRDSDSVCGCVNYTYRDGNQICIYCSHGAAWHKLNGGEIATATTNAGFGLASHHVKSDLTSCASSRPSWTLSRDSKMCFYGAAHDDDDNCSDDDEDDDEDLDLEIAKPSNPLSSTFNPASILGRTPGSKKTNSSHNGNFVNISGNLEDLNSGRGQNNKNPNGVDSSYLVAVLKKMNELKRQGLSEEEIETMLRNDERYQKANLLYSTNECTSVGTISEF